MRVAISIVLSLFVVGCEGGASPGKEKESFTDAPSPEGFTYVKGYGHRTSAFRTYTQEFEGQRRLDDTVNWYKEAWKVHDWTLAKEGAGDPAILTFVKKEEKAVVSVSSAGAGLKIKVEFSKKD